MIIIAQKISVAAVTPSSTVISAMYRNITGPIENSKNEIKQSVKIFIAIDMSSREKIASKSSENPIPICPNMRRVFLPNFTRRGIPTKAVAQLTTPTSIVPIFACFSES